MVVWKYSIDLHELLQTTWNRGKNRHVKSCKYLFRTPKVTVSSIWRNCFFLARSTYYFPSFIILILSFSLLTCSVKKLGVTSSIVLFAIPYYLLVYTFSQNKLNQLCFDLYRWLSQKIFLQKKFGNGKMKFITTLYIIAKFLTPFQVSLPKNCFC